MTAPLLPYCCRCTYLLGVHLSKVCLMMLGTQGPEETRALTNDPPPVEVLAGKNPALPYAPPLWMGIKVSMKISSTKKKKKKNFFVTWEEKLIFYWPAPFQSISHDYVVIVTLYVVYYILYIVIIILYYYIVIIIGVNPGVLNTCGLCRPYGRRASGADDRCGRNTFSLDWTLLIDYSKRKS